MSRTHDTNHLNLTGLQRLRAIAGVCSGALVEWFDFFIYAYTSIYFASLFFPAGDQVTQLLATAAVFAVGFFMRPLGGWIFGRIADKKGRKLSMMLSDLKQSGALNVTKSPHSTMSISSCFIHTPTRRSPPPASAIHES